MVIPGAQPGDGVREVPAPHTLRNLPVLTGAQAMAVTGARELAGHLRFAADVEGAFAGGSLYLLQARPILR